MWYNRSRRCFKYEHITVRTNISPHRMKCLEIATCHRKQHIAVAERHAFRRPVDNDPANLILHEPLSHCIWSRKPWFVNRSHKVAPCQTFCSSESVEKMEIGRA